MTLVPRRRAILSFWPPAFTIRARLTLWYVALLALILLAFSGFLYTSLSHSLYDALDSTLAIEARQLQQSIEIENKQLRLGEQMNQLTPGSVVALYDSSGQTLLDGVPRWSASALAGAIRQAANGHDDLATVRLQNGEQWRVLVTPVRDNGRTVGVLEVGRSEHEVEAALERLLLLMGIAVPVTLLLATGGGLFLADRALSPIDRITRTVRRIGAEDLSQRIGLPPSPDEVGRLAETFDVMLERLDRAFQRQRQFTADASHELRTPLAIIGGQIDVALQRRRRAEEYAEVLRDVRAEAERMRELVSDLLTLSRADAGRERLTLEPVSLDELAAEVAGQMTPLALARGLQLEVDATAPVVVSGDQTRLMQLLLNLVDNALKCTPSGGRVSIAAKKQDAWAVLQVSDTGMGIPAEHLPHLFERFYRVDKARSRAEGGAGLGLAICEWIAHTHGGRIEAASTPGRGSTFTVYLPMRKLPF
ncbi:MAG: ATP-binding protein [Chloroflexi bacterium]|nr:ATP-binding protein [Chloroflexota bacterium]